MTGTQLTNGAATEASRPAAVPFRLEVVVIHDAGGGLGGGFHAGTEGRAPGRV